MALAGSVAAMTLVLAGCGGGSNTTTSNNNSTPGTTSSSKPVEGGKISLDMISNIADLDPALAYDTQSDEIVGQLYDQLVTWAQGGSEQIVPMAAEAMPTVSSDGLTYTFKIRQDIKFWNGDPVTAQSFIDEFYRVLSPNLGSGGSQFFTDIVGAADYNAGKSKTIAGLSAPDTYSLKIQLVKPEPFLLDALTMPFISAVDDKFIKSVGNGKLYVKNDTFDSTQAMGSGPFELKTINANQIILTKNPNYWRTDSNGQKLPYLNEIDFTINGNDVADTEHFEQGQTAFIGWNFGGDGIPSDQYVSFMANPKYKALTKTQVQNSIQYLGLNYKYGPTKNPLVRQAIEYAINKPDILKLNNNRGHIANQPLPPAIPGYVQSLPSDATYSFDQAKAKALLAKAGYGPNNPLTIDYYDVNTPDAKKFDQGVQSQLAAVGIKLNIHESAWGPFLHAVEKAQAPMFWLAWIQDFPDASDFLNTLFNSNEIAAGNNLVSYDNPQVDKLLNDAEYSNDNSKRMQDYTQATDQIMKDAVWVPMWNDSFTSAAQTWVHGFYIPQVGQDPLQYIWIDKNHQ